MLKCEGRVLTASPEALTAGIAALVMARGIVSKGWVQGSLNVNDTRGVPFRSCLIGAMGRVNVHEWCEEAGVFSLMQDALVTTLAKFDASWGEYVGGYETSCSPSSILIGWNDEYGRTQKQVLGLIDQTITWLQSLQPVETAVIPETQIAVEMEVV